MMDEWSVVTRNIVKESFSKVLKRPTVSLQHSPVVVIGHAGVSRIPRYVDNLDFRVGLDFVWKHLPREVSLDDSRGVFGLSVDQLYRAGIVELKLVKLSHTAQLEILDSFIQDSF